MTDELSEVLVDERSTAPHAVRPHNCAVPHPTDAVTDWAENHRKIIGNESKGVSMLRVSRQTDYGLRLMVEIASDDRGPIATIEVAKRQDIPYQFLRKVARSLVAAGLLVSERGTGGGLSLARPPNSITMLDMVDSLDTVALNDCTVVPPRCDRRDRCAVFPVWARLQASVEGALGGITLSELATNQAKISRAQMARTALTAAPQLTCQVHTGGR